MTGERDDPRTIARQVVAAIRLAGIDTLFCLPGVQNDDFLRRRRRRRARAAGRAARDARPAGPVR